MDELSCKGKDFEHHERPGMDEEARWPGRWRCPDCGDSGSFDAVNRKLIRLVPQLYRLREQMLDRDAVFLLPSDAAPGRMGDFYGCPLFRVHGIDRPLIALGAPVLDAFTGPQLEAQTQDSHPL